MGMARKPLDPRCTGGVFCSVEGHIVHRRYANGRLVTSHVPLTKGQQRTLRERRRIQPPTTEPWRETPTAGEGGA